jgi:primosomal protein N' (replication factor Y)
MRGRPASLALAPELVEALRETFAGPGKAIVLYNRRGYAPTVECAGCGAFFECPSCRVGMVYHQRTQRVDCHYCGYHVPFRSDCQVCGGEIQLAGHGTERVEEELQAQFPDIGILRMDADTTRGRGAHASLLDRFRDGDARLLVGTQLVAKGHDFPDVHVAAVVGVDHLLMLPDFRSAERTYALVTQLAGRAGRGDVPGRVLVQTRHPDHFVFQRLAGDHDPEAPDETAAFYTEEARIRRVLGYPPFARLVLLRFEGVDREQTQARATELGQALRRSAASQGRDLSVLGPVAAPLPRLVGRWRFQIVLRGRDPARFRRWLHEIRPMLDRGVRAGSRLIVDVDPRNLL